MQHTDMVQVRQPDDATGPRQSSGRERPSNVRELAGQQPR